MARNRIFDHLQNFNFHLLDVSTVGVGFVPVPVFIPVLGFSEVTAPEMIGNVEKIVEGNNEFPRKVMRKAEVSTITCRRGSTVFDSDFWRWCISCVKGQGTESRRRTLLLVQFANLKLGTTAALLAGAGLALDVATSLAGRFSLLEAAAIEGGLVGVGAAVGLMPGKAWLLQKCIATRVKTGSDLDATSSDVSVMELDLEADQFEEFSLGS